jgi:hypothetical protein
MNGAIKGDHVTSLTEVRRLALLMLTTENTQLVLAGLAALDYERFAFRFFVEELGMRSDSWQPIDRNITRRAHRAVHATRAFLHLWTDENKLERIFLREISPTGFCAAANDALPTEFVLRSRLEPTWPLELSMKDEYSRVDKIFARARLECRLRYLSELEGRRLVRARVPGPLILTEIPYSRKLFGLRSSLLGFQGLEAYEAPPL